MPIDLTCSCGKKLRVPDELSGRQGKCPMCGGLLDIPVRDGVVGELSASPLDSARAFTATPERTAPEEHDTPERAITPLPSVPVEWSPEEPSFPRPEYKLFSPGAIGLVAFLAGPVGAFILLTVNYWRLGKRGAAWTTVVVGLLTVA